MALDLPEFENGCAACPDAIRADGTLRILVVDSDEETLAVHRLCLSGITFDGRSVAVSTARTVDDALFHVRRHPAIAVIFVPETVETPGDCWELIEGVRSRQGMGTTRIILRGASAGREGWRDRARAHDRNPEDWDVFDWRDGGDVSLPRLRGLAIGGLTVHRDRVALEASRRRERVLREGLFRAVSEEAAVFVQRGLVETVHRLARVGREADICANVCGLVMMVGDAEGEGRVLAAHGSFATWAGYALNTLPDPAVADFLRRAMRSGAPITGAEGMALTIRRRRAPDLVVFVGTGPIPIARDGDLWRALADGVGAALSAHALSRELVRERGRSDAADRRHRALEAAVEHAPLPIIHLSAAGDVLHANPLGAMMMEGWRPGPDGARRSPWPLPAIGPTSPGTGDDRGGDVFALTTAAGEFDVTISPRLPDGGAHLYFQEAGAARRNAELEERLNSRDPLTGLFNRAEFVRRLDARLRGRRGGDPDGFALLIIDVNDFTRLNEEAGFDVADEALGQLAARIKAVLRAPDLLGRTGADEFGAIVSGVFAPGGGVCPDRIATLSERIADAARRPLVARGTRLELSVSMGIAVAPTDGVEPEPLVHAARLALDAARREGAGMRMFHRRMDTAAQADRAMAIDLAAAMDGDGFELHYQPIVRLSDGALAGAEALLRWDHPGRGVVQPDVFIPVAERSGQILRLGEWVIGEACRRLESWRSGPLADVRIAVNISAIQLADPDLVTRVREALDRHGLPGSALKLEITETAAMCDVKRSLELLCGLRELGVALSIDDFGTGYSSLSHLRRLPVCEVKIDRAFVADIDSDADALSIVRAIVSLGHGMGLTVVAEGVERPSQVALLSEMGCDLAQGYLYGRPRPAESFLATTPTKPTLIRSA